MLDVVIDMREGGDWSLDLCFAGLRQNLGAEAVIDSPRRNKHREWAGVIQGLTHTDWGLERRTLGYTPWDDQRASFAVEEVRRVWLDERMESLQEYRRQGFWDAKVPVVVVAGHDRFWNHSPEFVASLYGERLEAMLLDNWYERYSRLPFRARRIAWSCNFDHYWSRPQAAPPKDIDICFVGYNSHPDRQRYVDHVIRRWGNQRNHIFLETRPDSFDNFVPKARLFDLMQRSKVCLNLRGAADRGKTLRAYEIPYVGSYMLSQRIDDPGMMEDFVDGVHCGYFDDEDELDTMIAGCLEHEGVREHVAAAGHRHAVEDLSSKARWRDVLGWLAEGRRD